jgi:hypothetical protein
MQIVSAQNSHARFALAALFLLSLAAPLVHVHDCDVDGPARYCPLCLAPAHEGFLDAAPVAAALLADALAVLAPPENESSVSHCFTEIPRLRAPPLF